MSDYNKPTDLWREIETLKKKVDKLERSNRLTSASIKEGALSILDSNSLTRLKIGKQLDGAYVGRGWDASGEGVNSPVWDTGFTQLRVVQTGTKSLTKGASVSNVSGSITHNLGFIPVFLVYADAFSGSERILIPYQEMNIDLDQTSRLTSLQSLFCHASSTQLFFEFLVGTSGSYFTASMTVNFRYYLLQVAGT